MSFQHDDVPAWLDKLVRHVERSRLAVLRFSDDEWAAITNSRRGTARFTVARPHANLYGLRAPTACLLVGREKDGTVMHFGVAESVRAVTTLESRLKVASAQSVSPSSEEEVIRLLSGRDGQSGLRSALNSTDSLVSLPPLVSARLVEGLGRNEANWPAMRAVGDGVDSRKVYAGPADLQADAVATALKVFGVSVDATAYSLYLAGPGESTLEQVRISEDSVIEHDARFVEGFELAKSDLTGKAVFVNDNNEVLEVITANRRPLEEVFGVDLIYVNAVMHNVVMVQYKMLEAERRNRKTDWIFRPDAHFREQVARMRRFASDRDPALGEYRINNEVFYLKFVKRDAALGRAPIIIPMDHFERLENDPRSRGPKGGFRVSYDSLGGRYLRQESFLGLVRSGYVGAYSGAASAFTSLIDAALRDGKGIVAAIQAERRNDDEVG